MKLLSWNIWVECDLEQVKEFLRASNADILGLQEVRDDDPKQDIIEFLKELGYQHVFARIEQEWIGKPYRQGPAVFSKYPIIHSETYLLDDVDHRTAARADVDVNGTILHVFSTHLVHTHQKPSVQQEAQTARLIEKLPSENVIVMGDFNATPDSLAIQMMNKILIDTDPTSAPTWSVYPEGCHECMRQAVDTRLDYIFISKDIQANSFKVERSEASDHLPISVNIEI